MCVCLEHAENATNHDNGDCAKTLGSRGSRARTLYFVECLFVFVFGLLSDDCFGALSRAKDRDQG